MITDPNDDGLDLSGADSAMVRVAEEVRRVAWATGTPLAQWRDGRMVIEPVPERPAGFPPTAGR